MELKTKIDAEEGKQDLLITREFDLPLELLYKAYVEPELVAQWMGTKVIKLETRQHGSWQYETTDPKGNKHGFHGVIHEVVPNERITRTFEMTNGPFPVQLEFLEFGALTDRTSKFTMHIVFRSVHWRDEMLKLPFAYGLNMAHNNLQEIVSKLIES